MECATTSMEHETDVTLIEADTTMVFTKCVECGKEDDMRTFIDVYNLYCSKACRRAFLHSRALTQQERCRTLLYFDFMTMKKFRKFLEVQHSSSDFVINLAPAHYFNSNLFNKHLGELLKANTLGDVLVSFETDTQPRKYWTAELVGLAGIFPRYRFIGCEHAFYGDFFNHDYRAHGSTRAQESRITEYCPPPDGSKHSEDLDPFRLNAQHKLMCDNLYQKFKDYHRNYRQDFEIDTTYESIDADLLRGKNDRVTIVSFFGEWIRVKHMSRDVCRWVHPRNDNIFPAGFSKLINFPIWCNEEYENESHLTELAGWQKSCCDDSLEKWSSTKGAVLEMIDPFFFQMTYAQIDKVYEKGYLLISWSHKQTKRVLRRCFHIFSPNLYYFGYSKKNGLPISDLPADYQEARKLDQPSLFVQNYKKNNPFKVGVVLETFHIRWEKVAIAIVNSICKRILVISFLGDPIRKYYIDFESPHLLPFGTSLLYRSDPANDMRLGKIDFHSLNFDTFVSSVKNFYSYMDQKTGGSNNLGPKANNVGYIDNSARLKTPTVLCRPELTFQLIQYLNVHYDKPLQLVKNALDVIMKDDEPLPLVQEPRVRNRPMITDWIVATKSFDILAVHDVRSALASEIIELDEEEVDEFVYIDDKACHEELNNQEEFEEDQKDMEWLDHDNCNQTTETKEQTEVVQTFEHRPRSEESMITPDKFLSTVNNNDLDLKKLANLHIINMVCNMPPPAKGTKILVFKQADTDQVLAIRSGWNMFIRTSFDRDLFQGYKTDEVEEVDIKSFDSKQFNELDCHKEEDVTLVPDDQEESSRMRVFLKNKNIFLNQSKPNKQGIKRVEIFDKSSKIPITFVFTEGQSANCLKDENGHTIIEDYHLAQWDDHEGVVIFDSEDRIDDCQSFEANQAEDGELSSKESQFYDSYDWEDMAESVVGCSNQQLLRFIKTNFPDFEEGFEAVKLMSLTGESLLSLYEIYSENRLGLSEPAWEEFQKIYQAFNAKNQAEMIDKLKDAIGRDWMEYDEEDKDVNDNNETDWVGKCGQDNVGSLVENEYASATPIGIV